MLVMFLVVESLSLLIPPLQSADESAHLSRAYLLSEGDIFLEAPDGDTGGNIDTGLVAYIASFDSVTSQYQTKVTRANILSSQQLTWTGRRQFQDIFNTAVYFPIPYIPQAAAFFIGEHAHLRIATTYYLSRLLSLFVALSLLFAAAALYPMPLFVLALFVTPMSLFQLASPSLDGVTFGTCALMAALFLRGSDPRVSFTRCMHAGLSLCCLSLAVSRIAMIPVTLLPLALFSKRRSYAYVLSAAFSFLLSVAWIAYAVVTVKGMPGREVGALGTLFEYVLHPASLFWIVFNTFTNTDVLWSYWAQFVGVFGYLDTPLDPYVYITFALCLGALVAISFWCDRFHRLDQGDWILIASAVLSLFLNFVIELITWTPPGAQEIEGIQGRYFTPVLIIGGYALFRGPPLQAAIKWEAAITVFFAAIAILSTVPKLLYRYWIS